MLISDEIEHSFRTVSFQKVVKPLLRSIAFELGFRTVSFQKVVKQSEILQLYVKVLELYHFRR